MKPMRRQVIQVDNCWGLTDEDCPFYRTDEDDSWCFLVPESDPSRGKYPPVKWLQPRNGVPDWCPLRHGSVAVELVLDEP